MKDRKHYFAGFEIIHHGGNYIEYLEKMKREFGPIQLRYPATTSLNGEDSAIMRIINSDNKNYVLMKPYLFHGSHDLKLVTNDVSQTLDEVVRKGLQKEAALLMENMTEVGYIDVDNTSPFVKKEKHRKHLISIDNYSVYLYLNYRPKFFVINTNPVWLSLYLEERVFKETVFIKGEPKPHPQLQCYEVFNEKPANKFFKV